MGVVASFRAWFRCGGVRQQAVWEWADGMTRFDNVALSSLDRVETDVGGDAIKPRPERNGTPEGLPALPGASQSLLDRVFGLMHRAQHPIAVDEQLAPVLGRLLSEGLGRIQQHSVIVRRIVQSEQAHRRADGAPLKDQRKDHDAVCDHRHGRLHPWLAAGCQGEGN